MADLNKDVMAVLDRLLVGSDRVLESVGDWAEQLTGEVDNSIVARVISQLDDEWYEADPPDTFCAEFSNRVRARMSARHSGWGHVWAHTLRVTGAALELADELDCDPVVVFLMAMCHDVAKLDEERLGEEHEELGAAFAAKTLRDYLNPSQIDAIQAAILKEGDDDLTQILHDADKLDKIGAAGLVRRVAPYTNRTWLSDALWRVRDDARYFPVMNTDLGRSMAAHKQAFQAWFVPLAERALGESDE